MIEMVFVIGIISPLTYIIYRIVHHQPVSELKSKNDYDFINKEKINE